MTNALKAICCLIVLSVAGFIWSCGPSNQNPGSNNTNATPGTSGEVKPAAFPNPGIQGFNFPEQAAIIDGWVKDGNNAEIYKHGWGIWAGLTTATTQVPPGGTQPLLVFETWLTPDEMIAAINGKPIVRSNRANLGKPNQFVHAQKNTGEKPDFSVAESVSYSPAAAKHAIDTKVFLWETLKGYADKGMTDIPAFPSDAITIKPVFKVIQKSKLDANGLFAMPSWHGPKDLPDDTSKINTSYPEKAWQSCIYVDIKNNGKGDGSQDMTCSAPSPATTYNLTDFINYTMNQEDVDYYNKEFGLNASAGDTAILVGMHVTTRETKKWTWQSFYWAANPADPKGPSSADIAKARPSQITGAAAHYAMAIAYAMVFPVQPDVGGESVGDTIYGYNPYLEAGFGNAYGLPPPAQSVFAGSNSLVTKNAQKIMTDAGIRTNCMSCHVYASVTGSDPCQSTTPYSGDAYVSLDDPAFKGQLKLDFAWSVQSNVQKNGAPCPAPTPAPASPSPTR